MRFFNIHFVAKHEKIREIFFLGKNLTMPKKVERGNPLGFSNIHFVAKHQKNAGGPFGERNSEKNFRKQMSRSAEKNERGTLWSRLVWYVTRKKKQVEPLWSSSLGQIVQVGAIIFCRTFRNYFGQFVWIEKESHNNSRVSLHEAPTKKHDEVEIFPPSSQKGVLRC